MSALVAQRAKAPSYRPNPYRKTPVASRAELHMMNRMGCGWSPSTLQQMRRAGGPQKWFEQQLRPGKIRENKLARSLGGWFPDLKQDPKTKWDRQKMGKKGGWEYAREFGNLTMLRRMYSNRPVLETMVDFWSDHLHVAANGDLSWMHRVSYDKLLRKHALGRFDAMLEAATLHPSMLLFLDNWRSVRNAPNENHGRELLELHTVGRSAGYTEQMVKDSAKILSGYTIDAWGTWQPSYDKRLHTMGRVQVLGFTHANAAADGRAVTRQYLRYLAHHPATARNIARKLAVRFVSDSPSDQLVNHLADVFRRSGTDIKATLRALVKHREFKRAADKKVARPVDDLVSTVRALQARAHRPRSDESFAMAISWVHRSILLYQWPRPDGPPLGNGAWASATRMLGSFRMHWGLIGGWWPSKEVAYRKPTYWLPQRRIRFDLYVDHLCRTMLGRRSTSTLLRAACQATDCRPGTTITRDHAVASWLFVRLVAVLLDSPEHMSR